METPLYLKKLPTLKKVFTPRAPIENQKIFAGRIEQLRNCIDLVYERGAHGILYGEIGVGKTSVANIVSIVLNASNITVAKCSCDSNDSFISLWKKLFRKINIPIDIAEKSIGFEKTRSTKTKKVSLGEIFEDAQLNATEVLRILEFVPKPLVLIIDEFDRLPLIFDRRLFSDIIKNISDNYPEITIIVVGVGDSVSDLIGEHPSIERNLKQIHLPIMTNEELITGSVK